ncbi:MerR family DNA-binding transcriptional regulator [Lysinibacillus sp. G4S2]
MYPIGQFSRKTGVSIRTLRYYDEMNEFVKAILHFENGT